MSELVQVRFHYEDLEPELASSLRLKEERLRIAGRIMQEQAINIGQELREAQQELAHCRKGTFVAWVVDVLGLNDGLAYRYMSFAERHSEIFLENKKLSLSAQLSLTAPDVSPAVTAAVVAQIESGETGTGVKEVNAAIKAAKEAEALAKAEAEAAKHDTEIAQQKLLDEQEEMESERKATQQRIEALEEALNSVEAELTEATKGDTIEVEVPDPKQAERIAELEAEAAEMKREKDDLEKRNKELGKYAEELEERAKQEALDRLQAEETRKLQMQWRSHANKIVKLLNEAAGLLPTVSELAVFDRQEWAHLEAVEQSLTHVATLIQQQRAQADRFVDTQLTVIDVEAA